MASLKTLVPVLVLAFVLFSFCEAKDILVGGSENAWKIPNNSSDSLNQWARKYRFRVGDFLILKYDSKVDSVLQVTKENYESCNTSKPINEYKDGNTKVELDESGPFYFISGADGHCQKGQKLQVVVMSEKHYDHDNPPVEPPTPAAAPVPSKSSTSQAQAKKGGCSLASASLLGVAFTFV
ncbi:early nodulin-like protein 1 [Durio zibethinus]|uniref:Early nodulin-like protein 1 n=1 Tax=Durio zibethinus TaxID=66656 RepID=A0A6P5XLQ0_DURZI|nr:early nodulin-like protein 1 [Durio zibethinus]